MAKRPGGAMIGNAAPTTSQLIPILSKWGELRNKAQLGPMVVTIAAVLLMFFYSRDTDPIIYRVGRDPFYWIYTSKFIILVATYLTLMSLYFIYRLVGKQTSWVGLLCCTAFTAYYIWLMKTADAFGFVYEFFHGFLAGGEPDPRTQTFFVLFYKHFVGTGFFEEFVKALPLLIIVGTAGMMSPTLKKLFRIEEPLDGILYGAAAGGGFAIMETLVQYVPQSLYRVWASLGSLDVGMALIGTSPGVQLMIPRSLSLSFGHMAYSGYFGYFIGLSVLKPEKRWRILGIGLISSSIPHALWDTVDSDILTMLVGTLSYAVLAAAVLKAREISPNRAVLQPSVVFGQFGAGAAAAQASAPPPAAQDAYPAPANAAFAFAGNAGHTYAPPVQVLPPPAPPMANLPPAPPNLPEGTRNLRIGAKFLIIVPGLRIMEHQTPGLRAQSPGGAVAEVTQHPQDPSVLGLTNYSTSTWEAVTPNGNRRQVQPAQTIKLTQGTRIDFGALDGEVR